MDKTLSNALFRSLGSHALLALTLSEHDITIIIAPWNNLDEKLKATFSKVKINFIETHDVPGVVDTDLNFPWDIIRFDTEQVDSTKWSFSFCCDNISIGFEAKLPEINIVDSSRKIT